MTARASLLLARASLLLLVLLLGCGGEEPVEVASAPPAAADAAPAPDQVELERVGSAALRAVIAASGTIEARRMTEVGSEVPGRIVEVLVDVGDNVEEGAPLFRIDSGPYRMALAEAEAGLALARAESANAQEEAARLRLLLEQKAASQQRYEQLRTQAEVARAQVAQGEARVAKARRDLAQTEVIAPYAGGVVERRAHEGAMAGQSPILVLQESGALEAILNVPEATPVPVRVGDPVRLFVEGLADPVEAKIERVSGRVDPGTRTYEVRGSVVDPSGLLKAGSYVRAELYLDARGAASGRAPLGVAHARRAHLRAARRGRRRALRAGARRDRRWRARRGAGGPRRGRAGRARRSHHAPRGRRAGRAAGRGSARRNYPRGAGVVRLAEISIRRPVFAAMLILGLVVLGLVSLGRLELKLDPDVDFPFAVVVTELRGASPETVEREVTDVLEEQLNAIEGVRNLSSTSSQGLSRVHIEFSLACDIDIKVQEVRDKVALARPLLPVDVEDPVVQKFDLASVGFMTIVLGGPLSRRDLSDFAEHEVKERLERIAGVGGVNIMGAREREIRIWLDPLRLTGYGLSIEDVSDTLRRENAELASGRIEGAEREWTVTTQGKAKSVEEFGEIIVAEREGRAIRLRDVAVVEDGMAEEQSVARFDGEPGVALEIQQQSGSDLVAAAREIRKELEHIRAQAPPGVERDRGARLRAHHRGAGLLRALRHAAGRAAWWSPSCSASCATTAPR